MTRISVLLSPDGLIHFPDEGGELALCGLASPLERQQRPDHWAGVWCSACMRAAAATGKRRPMP